MSSSPFPGPDILPANGVSPVVLSVPHAGRDYPDELQSLARTSLTFLEDPYVDELVQPAVSRGHAAVIARTPRAAVDCNRGEEELDPRAVLGVDGPIGARAEAGLGLVASRSPLGGSLWHRPIGRDELDERLDAAHRPYHAALDGLLDEAVRRHGVAFLVDCHSMPSRRRGTAQVVLGDRHGDSADPFVIDTAARVAKTLGFSVALNHPFAGGHIVARHGKPEAGIHALQIEVDRGCYCRADGHTPGPGVERVALLFDRIALALAHALPSAAIAAE